jgi:hypothetical protein
MHIPKNMKSKLRTALIKLDDCRALLEEITGDIIIEDTPEYVDTIDVLRYEISDMLEDIYQVDQSIARWAYDVPNNDD